MAEVKVTHSNQTLILASERRVSSAKPDNTLDRAVNAASKGGTLKRVTIVASQPDEGVVYVHADYADGSVETTGASTAARSATTINTAAAGRNQRNSSAQAEGSTSTGTAIVRPSSALLRSVSSLGVAGDSRDAYGNHYGGGDALTSHLRPTEQYARTQRLVSATAPVSLIDVLA